MNSFYIMQIIRIYINRAISDCIYEINIGGADTKNRTRDLLITKHIYNLTIFINQSLKTLATAKTNFTQPQSMVFQR